MVEELEDGVLVCHGRKSTILNAPQLYMMQAEYQPLATRKKTNVMVLVDDLRSVDNKVIKTVAGLLGKRIGSAGGGFATGILPCLGFKGSELLFRLPCNAVTKTNIPTTLQTAISDDVTKGRVASLEKRFDLARQLADMVFMLHTSNLMHKNLRGDTILLLRSKNEPKTATVPVQADLKTASTDNVAEDGKPTVKGKVGEQAEENEGGRGNFIKQLPLRMRRSFSGRGWKEKDKDRGKNKDSDKDGMGSGTTENQGRKTNSPDMPPPPGRLEQWLPQDSIVPILTHWSEAKQHGATSHRAGPSENDWHIKVYRHPSQQDTDTNTAYNFGHDIYALGVCLLEIGLWHPLVCLSATASTHLLSAGGVATVEILKTALQKALKKHPTRDGGQVKETIVSALKEDAGIAAALRLGKELDALNVGGDGETGHLLTDRMRDENNRVLRKEGHHGASHRLRGALVEVLIDEALEDKQDSSATIATARRLRKAVNSAKESVTATANQLKGAMETALEDVRGVEGIDASGLADIELAINSAVKNVVTETGVGAEVLRIALRLEEAMKREVQKGGDGTAVAKAVRTAGKRKSHKITEDELNSLLKEDGGEALRDAFVGLAEQQLPATMGAHYTRLVVKCLRVLNGGFGDGVQFENLTQLDACIHLDTEIVAPLRRVNLGE
ncbi:hypothetical protein QQS21_009832 [Conoideocrella luteorostrata]|uniref:Protein kinase domain-containing protein n=1 Tax=Conoideocrella luteorostrata TaxID=1105319 RepID=A0AAJ0FV95_9HYPO|nr:hypothetical protein QQS21_009832 [Conoideocrella luteorostrata]